VVVATITDAHFPDRDLNEATGAADTPRA